MAWLLVVAALLLLCFAGVLLFGAPYLPTLKPQISVALELANLKPGQTLIELGSGDGRVLLAAARQGVQSIGYELNPVLVLLSWLITFRYRRYVRIIWGDFWRAEWPPADTVFTFLLPRYMEKLHTKMVHYPHKPVDLVSFAFTIPTKKPSKTKAGVYLYRYR